MRILWHHSRKNDTVLMSTTGVDYVTKNVDSYSDTRASVRSVTDVGCWEQSALQSIPKIRGFRSGLYANPIHHLLCA